MLFRKCHPEHVLLIEAQASQRSQFAASLGPALGSIATEGEAYSGWHDHRCLMAGGVAPKWRGVGVGWTLLSEACGPHMLAITRKTRAVVRGSGYRRVEFYVLAGFEAGHRWARQLGFTKEADCMRGFCPDGRDMALYAYTGALDG